MSAFLFPSSVEVNGTVEVNWRQTKVGADEMHIGRGELGGTNAILADREFDSPVVSVGTQEAVARWIL